MPPTQRLGGTHFVGTVKRCWISSHALDPENVPLPENVKPWIDEGRLWLSDCFVHIAGIRPAGAPRAIGLPFRYLVHRVMAHVPFPDGKSRKAVFVLQAYGDPPLSRWFGRTLGGAPFQAAKIAWDPEGHVVATRKDETLYEAEYKRGWQGQMSLEDADETILGMSFGSRCDGGWRLFPETHDPWNPEPWVTTTKIHALLADWGIESEADHCMGMVDVPHYFGRPIRVRI